MMERLTTAVTKDDILARARAMLPMLRERAAETEALRRLPDATDRAFAEADFYKIMQPRRYGGLELDFGTQTQLGAELGRACGSSAWVATVICCHAWLVGMFPKAAQDEVWGDDPGTTIASSFQPVGAKAERVAGGLRLSGRWKYSSGVDHCRWAALVVPVAPPPGEKPRAYFALLPRSDYRIDDTWRALGLCGSGSNDVVVEGAFVPEHRLLDMDGLMGGPTPGSEVNDGYLYRMPLFGPFAYNLVGNGLGVARGVADVIIEGLKEQRSARGGAPVAANQSVQLRVAEATAEIDAAHAVIFGNCAEIVRRCRAGETLTREDRVRYRRDIGFAGLLCVRAVERLFPILGARGLMSDHPAQRGWRDLRAISHHIGLTWDIQGTLYGSVILGQPCPDPRV